MFILHKINKNKQFRSNLSSNLQIIAMTVELSANINNVRAVTSNIMRMYYNQ